MWKPASYVDDNQSRLVAQGPVLLTGVIIDSTDATGKINIYDGLNATSGRKVMDVGSPTTAPFVHSFERPVYLGQGLYVEVVATIHDYTILFVPLANDPPSDMNNRNNSEY